MSLILMLLCFELSSLVHRTITLYSSFALEETIIQKLKMQFRLHMQLFIIHTVGRIKHLMT